MCNSFIDSMHFSLNMMNDECYQFNFQLILPYSFSIVQKPLNFSELKIFNLKIVGDVLSNECKWWLWYQNEIFVSMPKNPTQNTPNEITFKVYSKSVYSKIETSYFHE